MMQISGLDSRRIRIIAQPDCEACSVTFDFNGLTNFVSCLIKLRFHLHVRIESILCLDNDKYMTGGVEYNR
jgi:hypothetical protein